MRFLLFKILQQASISQHEIKALAPVSIGRHLSFFLTASLLEVSETKSYSLFWHPREAILIKTHIRFSYFCN